MPRHNHSYGEETKKQLEQIAVKWGCIKSDGSPNLSETIRLLTKKEYNASFLSSSISATTTNTACFGNYQKNSPECRNCNYSATCYDKAFAQKDNK